MDAVIRALGADGERPASETAAACLDVAAQRLAAILEERRFQRDGALDLLTVDALVTYAFEHASMSTPADLSGMAAAAIRRLGALAPAA